LHDEHWHKGVIGIVAGRLKERLFKPTFVMATGKTGELVGSGRSIPGFHLRHALDHVNKRCPGVLVKFGGHAMAAGATLRAGTFEIFKAAFEEVARELITPATLNQVVETDGSLALDDASLNTEADLRKYVWGQGFPLPSFDDVFKVKSSKLVGKKSEHLQLVLERGGRTFQGIKFRYEGGAVPEWARLIYKLEANTFNNNTRLQLMVEHLLPV